MGSVYTEWSPLLALSLRIWFVSVKSAAADNQGLARSLFNNALFSILGRFAGLIVGILTSPLLLSSLGDAQFAAWVLAMTVAFHLNILSEFGSSLSLIYHIADGRKDPEHLARSQHNAWSSHLVTVALSTVIKLILVLIFCLSAPLFIDQPIFGQSFSSAQFGLVVILIFLIAFVRPLFLAFECFFQGFEDFVPIGQIQLIRALCWLFAVWILSSYYPGLIAILCADIVVSTIVGLYGWRLLFKRHDVSPWLKLRKPDREHLTRHMRYGLKIYASQCADLLQNYSDKIVLGSSKLQLRSYELSQKLSLQAHSLLIIIAGITLPTVSKLKKSDPSLIAKLFAVLQKAMAICAGLGYGLMIVAAPLVLGLWLGPANVDLLMVRALQFLAFQALLLSVSAGPVQIARGLGKLETEVKAMLILSVVGFGVRLACFAKFGFVGLLGATVALAVLTSAYLLYRYSQEWAFSIAQTLWRSSGASLCACVLSIALIYWFLGTSFDVPDEFLAGMRRQDCLPYLGKVALAYFALYSLFFLVFGGYDDDLRTLIRQFYAMIRRRG